MLPRSQAFRCAPCRMRSTIPTRSPLRRLRASRLRSRSSGYIRNDAARQLRAGTNRAVGMIVLDIANPFFTDVARGVEDVLIAESRPLILGNSAQEPTRETSYLDLFEQQRISGVLITPVGDVMDRLRACATAGRASSWSTG